MGKTYQSIVINAPIDQVWTSVRDFHNLSWAPNVITKCEKIGDPAGAQIGAKRILNDAFHETLVELSDLDHSFRYSIDDGPSPVSPNEVSNYIGSVRLLPVTDSGTTFLEWSSSWEGKDDQACDFCHNIYLALLADLKKTLE